MNEMSGSRGEANFVWKCKNCKVSAWNPSRGPRDLWAKMRAARIVGQHQGGTEAVPAG